MLRDFCFWVTFAPVMVEEIIKVLQAHKVKLVAVSKTHTPEQILEIYRLDQRIFGENRVQEMLFKHEALPKDIQWHMIGHLQTNKVKQIAPFVAMVHSVDRLPLLEEINRQAEKVNRKIKCLLQFYIAQEETKFGLDMDEAVALLESASFAAMKNVEICGVMGMASFTDNQIQVRGEFRQLKANFDLLAARFFKDNPGFCEISMGMSGDWEIAIEEGATMVRIGSLIFGAR